MLLVIVLSVTFFIVMLSDSMQNAIMLSVLALLDCRGEGMIKCQNVCERERERE